MLFNYLTFLLQARDDTCHFIFIYICIYLPVSPFCIKLETLSTLRFLFFGNMQFTFK